MTPLKDSGSQQQGTVRFAPNQTLHCGLTLRAEAKLDESSLRFLASAGSRLSLGQAGGDVPDAGVR